MPREVSTRKSHGEEFFGSEKDKYKKRKRRYRLVLILALILGCMGICVLALERLNNRIPDQINILVGKEEVLSLGIPMEAELNTDDITVIQTNTERLPANSLHLNLNEPVILESSKTGSYEMVLKLFGIFEFKKISLDVIEAMEVIPCGMPIGITMETNGILVLGTGTIAGADGMNYEPALNLLKTGDYIHEVNGKTIKQKEELIAAIQESPQESVLLTVERSKELIQVEITPVKSTAGDYKIGAWIRDDSQGIGTLTFITTNGKFGALGHGITDVDTGGLIQISGGTIYDAEIVSIIKGKAGEPGELSGYILKSEDHLLGEVSQNTGQGVFGSLNGLGRSSGSLFGTNSSKKVEIGLRQQVKTGSAIILSDVSGTLEEYTIEIEEINLGSNNLNKGMVISITDERLLELTGGIVQGMSGSPILQNGKLIGAVTHVFVKDAARGYGIFIENMLQMLE